jgi:predicted nucleic acid-binding protein
MPVLIDATVLSNLAAVERLDLLNLLRDTLYVASAVYEEIQQGLEQGYEFLTNVDQALDSGLFLLITLKDEDEWRQYRAMPGKLQRGEAMSLAIARFRGWRFLTDDRAARMQARRLGVSCSGTLGLLLYAVRRGHLTLEEGNALLAGMIARARYRSPVSDLQVLLEEGRE